MKTTMVTMLVFVVAAAFTGPSMVQAQGLVLWNKPGSEAEIENSEKEEKI